MADISNNGLIHLRSHRSVPETCAAIIAVIRRKGLSIVAHIDHSSAAAKAGLEMRPTQLLIFGSAASGTPMMLAAPTLAIDLPLKVLVWESVDGCVWITYNDARYLQKRHTVPEELIGNISGVGSLFDGAVGSP